MEAILTICPVLRSIMEGSTERHAKKIERKFVSMRVSKSSSLKSTTGPKMPTPAALTRMSTGPHCGRHLLEKPFKLLFLSNIRRDHTCGRADEACRSVKFSSASGRQHHLRPEMSKLNGNGAADSSSRAGNNSNLISNTNHPSISRDGDFLILVLQLIQLVINAALSKQLLMCAALPHASLVHNDDLIAALNRGQAMRDDD